MTGPAERRHVLVVANETLTGERLSASLLRRAEAGPLTVTVVCPINQPRAGYVVYEETRRAAAERRLERTLAGLEKAGIAASGLVVESDPVAAVRDALAQADAPASEVIVSTHPEQKSRWLRRNVVERIRREVSPLPVEHVVAEVPAEGGEANVLVLANETVVGEPLLERIRARAERSPASFLIVCPQSDATRGSHPEAERRLARALAELRGKGIDAHGQIAHPDPHTAALHAISDERIDEILVSTFPQKRSGWLRRDLVERLRRSTGLPVEHVVVDPSQVESAAA